MILATLLVSGEVNQTNIWLIYALKILFEYLGYQSNVLSDKRAFFWNFMTRLSKVLGTSHPRLRDYTSNIHEVKKKGKIVLQSFEHTVWFQRKSYLELFSTIQTLSKFKATNNLSVYLQDGKLELRSPIQVTIYLVESK